MRNMNETIFHDCDPPPQKESIHLILRWLLNTDMGQNRQATWKLSIFKNVSI